MMAGNIPRRALRRLYFHMQLYTVYIMSEASPNPKPTRREKLPNQMATLTISAAGTAVFLWLGLPLPFLFGPLVGCLLAALFGVPLIGTGQVAVAARTILGLAVGASVTPEVIDRLPQMIASVAFVPLYVLIIGVIGVPFFQRICGFDRATAYFASMPGGLQDMVVFGQEAGGDVRALALIHATRILIVITIAPIVMVNLFGVTLSNPIGEPASDVPLSQMLILAAAGLVGWKGGERIGLFGATIIGPLVIATILSMTGVLHHRPPAEALNVAQFFIGGGIGVCYVGITLREIRKDVLAGVAFAMILAALAFVFTEIVVQTGFAKPVEGFLSFAPGGQAEMAVLAIVAGADLGFIVIHHLVRIMVVLAGGPAFARIIGLIGPRQK